MGWGRDPEKFRRQRQEARTFWGIARGRTPAGPEDLVGRPFRVPDDRPYPAPRDDAPVGPGDDGGLMQRLQDLEAMYERGSLSPAEYSAAKAQILHGR